jgi:hypothetical protein
MMRDFFYLIFLHEIPTSGSKPSINDYWGFHVTIKKSRL